MKKESMIELAKRFSVKRRKKSFIGKERISTDAHAELQPYISTSIDTCFRPVYVQHWRLSLWPNTHNNCKRIDLIKVKLFP